MKSLKFTIAVLLIAITTSVVYVKAVDPNITAYVVMTLEKQEVKQYSGWETKTNTKTQSYENIKTYTSWTNPCESCQIIVKPKDKDGALFTGRTVTMGKTTALDANVSWPGTYTLLLARADFTLLDTHTSGYWNVQ